MHLVCKDKGSVLMCTTAAILTPSLQKSFGYLCSFLLAYFFPGVALLLFPLELFGAPALTGLSCM